MSNNVYLFKNLIINFFSNSHHLMIIMASSLSCFQLSKFGEHNIFVHGVHVLWNSRDLKLIMPKKTKKNISVK